MEASSTEQLGTTVLLWQIASKPVSEQQLLLQADQVVPVAERAFRNV
ncbi:hypothetical protein RESH_03059 [Rhodopirellula europaea SH398]|uniref:Uncharacterized protein n=1 Tax=Rhodopirellula europaea SH398 TaxID=1263868 RepID=M5S3P7_9BACT|nr:hypothetical protein RESH_03059 [Rhodopirellula europaea SH398]